MVKKKKTEEPTETLKTEDATPPPPPPEPAPEPGEVNAALLADLPLPAFHRITALRVGGSVAAIEDAKRSLMFVRGTPTLYACGPVRKTKAEDVPARLAELRAACKAGRGGDVFSSADFRAEFARRRVLN